jgi:hypothetical protein
MTNPIETKVAAASSTSVLVGMITWILVTYVPEFQKGLPGPLATFLTWMVPAVLATVAGYFAPHTSVTPTPAAAPQPPPANPAAAAPHAGA